MKLANPWFRLYSEFADDPKVQIMSEAMQRRLLMLMCSRCKGETLHETEMSFHWRITPAELAETKAVFLEKGFIDEDWDLINWNRRQFISDSSTDRVRKYRQGKKQNETLHETDETKGNVTVTPPDTDTDTDTEQIQKQSKDSCPPASQADEVEQKKSEDSQINRLFDYYCRKLKRDPKKYTLTEKRREKARSRLRERGELTAAVDDAKLCIDNLAASDHHREGGYIDWESQIFRSKEEFEKRLNWIKPTGGTNGKPRRSTAAGNEEAFRGLIPEPVEAGSHSEGAETPGGHLGP